MADNFDKRPVQKYGTQVKAPPKVMVYKCGDKHDQGKQFVINKNFRTLEQLQRKVAQEIGFLPSLRGLYTIDGNAITSLGDIEDKSILIAVRTGESFSAQKLPSACAVDEGQ